MSVIEETKALRLQIVEQPLEDTVYPQLPVTPAWTEVEGLMHHCESGALLPFVTSPGTCYKT